MSLQKIKIFSTLLITLFFSSISYSAVPRQINYQGKLTDNAGQPLTGPAYVFVFTLYDDLTAGLAKWSETYSGANAVPVANGLYNVRLGSINNTLGDLAFDTTYYLEIKVGTTLPAVETLSPRQILATVPYAFRSKLADSIGAGTLNDNVKITTGSISANGNPTADTFLAGNGYWATPSARAISDGTLINTVKVTTGSIVASGTASNSTFLRGDGSWQGVGGGGDMFKASDGLAILQATSTLRTDLNSVRYSTFTVAAGTGGINLTTAGSTKTFNVIASSFQAGAYENIQVGTSTLALGIAAGNIDDGTIVNTVKVTTGSIVASGTASNSTFLRGDGSWQGVGGGGDMFKATDGAAIGISTGNIQSQVNSVQYSTFTVAAGTGGINLTTAGSTKTFNVTASSFQAGAYENIRVGTSTVALGIAAGNIDPGTIINTVKVTTGSIVASGTASNSTFLRGDGSWQGVGGGGDMFKASDGLAILQATSTLRTEINQLHIDTGAIIPGNIVAGILSNNVSISSVQAGAYENVRVGTATIALSIAPVNVRAGYLLDTVRVTTASIVTTAGTASASTFLRGDGSWQGVGGGGDMFKASDGVAIGISTGNIQSQVNSVQYSTFTVGAGTGGINLTTAGSTKTFNVIASSFQAGAYENIRVGTSTLALGVNASGTPNGTTFLRGDYSWQTVGDMFRAADGLNILQATSTLRTELNQLHIDTGAVIPSKIVAGILPNTVSISSIQAGAYENVRVGTATIALGVAAGSIVDSNISVSAGISGSKLSDSLVVSSVTATGYVGLQEMTVAQLSGATPTARGHLYYCNEDRNVYVSTDTTIGSFSKLSNPASGPGNP